MGRRRHTPEQIITALREAEVGLASGKTAAMVSRELGISEQTYYRWRKEFGGLKVDQARKLRELERENAHLKRAVANLGSNRRPSAWEVGQESPKSADFVWLSHLCSAFAASPPCFRLVSPTTEAQFRHSQAGCCQIVASVQEGLSLDVTPISQLCRQPS